VVELLLPLSLFVVYLVINMCESKLIYLDDDFPAYLIFDSYGDFVEKITLKLLSGNVFTTEGFELIYELPLHIKELPIRIPPDASENLIDLIYYDVFEYDGDSRDKEYLDYPKFPFETKNLVEYFQSWGSKGWKYLES
jgi:hypothetical protein